MIMNNFIVSYINKLNEDSAKIFALKFGIIFSDNEIKIILPYLKNNSTYLLSLNDIYKKIHIDLDTKIGVNSVNKLCLLFNKLGYN